MSASQDRLAFGFSGIEPSLEEYAVQFFRDFEPFFRPFFSEASDFAGFDFTKLMADPEAEKLDPLTNQIFTFAYSLGVDSVLKGHGFRPDLVAGFSLGVYAALCSAGAVKVSAGLRMVRTAYELMHRESKTASFGMSAVVGLSDSDTADLINSNHLKSIQRVNTLNDTCRIYSGKADELAAMNRLAQENGAITAASLPVDIPYHHPDFLKQATDDFREFLSTLEWNNAEIPLISSIDQRALSDKKDLIEFTAQNLSQPIHWQAVVVKFSDFGCSHLAECGPGITLTQNGRFLDTPVKYLNTKNIKKRLGL